jgi:mannosyltransferase
MSTVSSPQRDQPRVWLPEYEDKLPAWAMRWPVWLRVGVFLFVLMAISVFIRTRYLSGELWMNEGLILGISTHSLSAIPGVLRHDGSPPLFFWLLHIWMLAFGTSESATHSLSLLFGMLTVPVALWAGWSLFGTRAGVTAAVTFALSGFITDYSQETGMYTLMALLGLIATAAFLHAFVYRRRKYLILFALAQTLMLYTHAWAVFYFAGAAIAVVLLMASSDEPRALLNDGLFCFVGAAILFLPWLPTFIYQLAHSTEPWDSSARYGAPRLSLNLLGGDRVTVALGVATAIAVATIVARARRRTPEARAVWALILIPVAALLLALIASSVTPVWIARYFAPTLGPVLLLAAWGLARSGIIGVVALVLCVAFLADPSSFSPQYKSDMRDVSAEVTPLLHQGDLVVTGQPEQIALIWYYLPREVRFASTLGPVTDPRYMNWDNAYNRLRAANPATTLDPMVASLRPGQQLLYVRPLTEGEASWKASWTQLVRRRSAQWGAILQSDVNRGILKPIAVAPHNYRGSCCVADSAVLYRKLN